MVTFGRFMAYLFNREIGWHLIPAALIAVAAHGVVGTLQSSASGTRCAAVGRA